MDAPAPLERCAMVEITLDQRRADLLAQVTAAAMAGDLDRVAAIGKEAANLSKVVQADEAKATEGIRTTAKANLEAALASREVRDAIRQALRQTELRFTVKRSTTGLDNASSVVDSGKVFDVLSAAVAEHFGNIVSAKGVKVTMTADGRPQVEVSITGGGGAPRQGGSGNGGGGGKGWIKDGVVHELKDVFELHATAEQKASLPALDGNGQYVLKKKVAKDSGYTLNG